MLYRISGVALPGLAVPGGHLRKVEDRSAVGNIVWFGRSRQLKYDIWRCVMHIRRKSVEDYGNYLNALIADVQGDSPMGDVVFITLAGGSATDDVVAMKVGQLLKLLVPNEATPLVAEAVNPGVTDAVNPGGH
jgi:hypothetical protein